MRTYSIAIMTMVLALTMAGVAEMMQASKNDNLREKPFIDGKVLTAVKSGQSVDVQKREGSWYFVKVGTITGWLPMLSVRRTTPAPVATKESPVRTGRSSTGAVVNTTGVRGLNEETLKTATFSEEAVAAAEKYRIPVPEAVAFAAAGGVTARSVPSIAAPATIPNGGTK